MKAKLTDALSAFCTHSLPRTPLLISSPDASDLFGTYVLARFVCLLAFPYCSFLYACNAASDPRATELTALVPAFLANLDQASRLRAGAVESTVMWLSSEIVYQTHRDGLVFSALLADNANIGLVDKKLSALATAIKPLLLLNDSK